jgi:hypothetical protein
MGETGFDITCSPIIPRSLEDVFVPEARGRVSTLGVVRLGFVSTEPGNWLAQPQ